MNDNGESITNSFKNNNLVIGETLFLSKTIHTVTWTSPDMRTENQIGHILIGSNWRTSVLDVRNKRRSDFTSDDHLVIGHLRMKLAAVNRSNILNQPKYNIEKLRT